MLKWIFKKQVLEGVKAKVEDSHAALKQVIPILLKEDSDDLQIGRASRRERVSSPV